MRPSSSRSDTLFGALSGSPAVDREVDGAAWLRAMLDVERALAAAQARAGVIPVAAAEAVAAAVDGADLDPADLGRRAVASGNPVVPLVAALARAAPAVHHGATSQDVLDTAAGLVAYRATGLILGDLAEVAAQAARLAAAHRDTVLIGRTLGQQAVPTTFGLKCAGWLVAVDEAAAALKAVREKRLAVQFGGAAGTLAASPHPEVVALLADELGLAAPVIPWHTDRTRIAELAGALGTTTGVLGKIALDVVLLAQTEIGEVAEGTGGGSSTMPHKQNPVRAVLVRAAAQRTPALVATILAAMPQEHERAAGAWHAEWEPLTDLLRITGGAAAHTRDLLAGLRVDAARMRANLDRAGGLPMAESVAGRLAPALGRAAAQDLVTRLAVEPGPFRAALLADPAVRAHLDEAEIDEALDPVRYLGAAGEFVDRALRRGDR
jgi:3-carboxy-cis,cis-muconate cycloisomerase